MQEHNRLVEVPPVRTEKFGLVAWLKADPCSTAFAVVGMMPACENRARVVRETISLGSPDASMTV